MQKTSSPFILVFLSLLFGLIFQLHAMLEEVDEMPPDQIAGLLRPQDGLRVPHNSPAFGASADPEDLIDNLKFCSLAPGSPFSIEEEADQFLSRWQGLFQGQPVYRFPTFSPLIVGDFVDLKEHIFMQQYKVGDPLHLEEVKRQASIFYTDFYTRCLATSLTFEDLLAALKPALLTLLQEKSQVSPID